MGKELAEQYENEMFDFEQLSASLVSVHTVTSEMNHLIHLLNFCCFKVIRVNQTVVFNRKKLVVCVV